MTTLSPLNRFLVFVLVGGMFASLAFYAAQRTAPIWKRPFVHFARASRPIQTLVLAGLIVVTAIGGGKTNDPPLRALGDVTSPRIVANPPAWFVALGYPAADADENGIPDCWEKWTHTAGMAGDADPDGDGLTNLAEFEAQTDPIRADTDGDGLDDGTELAGLAAGVADLDPITPATFSADEPDANGDDIPDLWEGSDAILFDGCDPDGFPWDVSVPEAAATNYDVRLSVSSSRHAALSWGTDESLLLPPCTNLALRLRLTADDIKIVELVPSPTLSTNPVGTWRAALVADWDARRCLPTEGDRLALADGTMVDRSAHESVSVEALMSQPALRSGEPLRARGGGRKPAISFTPRRIIVTSDGSFCPEHGPAPVVRVSTIHASPPFVWTERGSETETDGTIYTANRPYSDGHYEVSVRWKDAHRALWFSDSISLVPIQCRPGETNLVGAAWSSTHDPTDASDHAPGIETHDVSFGPNCPMAHDATVRIGWSHDETVLHIRNLPWLVSGDSAYDRADHCIGVSWAHEGTINLTSFLDETALPYMGDFVFVINSQTAPPSFPMGGVPTRLFPRELLVELRRSGAALPLDTLVVTVFHPFEQLDFNTWRTRNANLSWTSGLPPSPRHKPVSETQEWYGPETPGLYMHHGASFEIRSKPVSGGHGHQATYDQAGYLVTNGTIAAGTADYASPESAFDGSMSNHREMDVKPYLLAVHLDGNPGRPDNLTGLIPEVVPARLSRPCIYQGTNINHYLTLRPSFPTGIEENE